VTGQKISLREKIF